MLTKNLDRSEEEQHRDQQQGTMCTILSVHDLCLVMYYAQHFEVGENQARGWLKAFAGPYAP